MFIIFASMDANDVAFYPPLLVAGAVYVDVTRPHVLGYPIHVHSSNDVCMPLVGIAVLN